MVDTTETESTKDKIEESAKKANIDTSKVDGKKEWLRVGGIKLTINDRNSIMRGERLNDMIINAAQKLLKSRFPKIKGLNSTLLQAKKNLNACTFEENKVQIIHSRGNHWIVAATVGDELEKTVKVYDSVYNNIDDGTCKIISKYQMFLDLWQHLATSTPRSNQE